MKRLLILSLALSMIAGCGDDDPVTPPTPEPIAPFAGSAPQLVANFKTAYESLDVDRHRVLLHPDFVTILQQETIDQFPDLGGSIDYDMERRIHDRMFSGDDVVDPNGQFVPGMEGIHFGVIIQLADWTAAKAEEWPAGTVFAPYEVDILFNRGEEYSQMRAQGQIVFYAVARDSVHEGETRDYYEMVGQVDQTGFSKIGESGTWGGAKALYR